MRARGFSRLRALAALAAAMLLALACGGCAGPRVDDSSPRASGASLASASAGSEASQRVEVRLSFDAPISTAGDVEDDFEFLLNGAAVEGAVMLEAVPSAEAITFALRPSPSAQEVGRGAYFALYECSFSLAPKRADGALPHVLGAGGACAVMEEAVSGTLPSGLAIETTSQRPGSAPAGEPAQAVFRVVQPAQVRAITWFSPDGGATKLLKHNHAFADATAEDCAADLAALVNRQSSSLGLRAQCAGDAVTLTALEAVDGQLIEPVVVEGVGASGGVYDGSAPDGAGA